MMTALPDLTEAFQAIERRSVLCEPVKTPGGLGELAGRAVAASVAAALLFAAAGIWAVPAVDHAVMLVKLGASLALFGMAAVLLSALVTRPESNRVEIDTKRNEIRTYDRAMGGQMFLTGRYKLNEMSDISLHNGTFIARDTGGQLLVAVPVRGRAQAMAIRAALALG